MRRLACLLVLLLPLLVACGLGGSPAPTPFPTAAGTPSPTASGPVALTVAELAAAPGLYVDTVVQVSGLFRKQPLLVCDAEPHRSPAAWGLAEEGLLAPAGGYDQQVRSLLPEGLLMTVEGRWRRWEGLVGCGKAAVTREVWYLDVARILSPSPLVQVTLTPGVGGGDEPGTAVAEVTPTLESDVLPTEDPSLFPTPLPEEEFATSPADDFPIATEEAFPTVPLDVTAESTPINGLPTPGGTPTLGTTTPGATGTPTVTGTPATATPTITGTPPTATPTTTGSGQVTSKGDLRNLEGEFTTTTLAAGATDSWQMEIFEDETYTVYVQAPAPADIVVTLLKDDQVIVDRQNTAAPGAPETITAPGGAVEGLYELRVATSNGAATDYAVVLVPDPETVYTVNGMIAPDLPRNGVAMTGDVSHFWFFTATAGDDVTITAEPNGGDLNVELYGPDGNYLDEFDDGFDNEADTVEWSVETNGLHAIVIYEWDGASITYDLTMTRN
jgi:hypothetical protein